MADRKALLDRFNEDKYGMFIHWGPYAMLGGEWKEHKRKDWGEWIMKHANISSDEYEQPCSKFSPTKFDAEEWVRIALDSGQRYMVLTTKHHDGFCMFRSKHTEYNIVDFTPFGRDPVAELAEACNRHGMRLGLYYSIADWHHPEFPAKYSHDGFHGRPNPNADINAYADYQLAQMEELLTNYGPLSTVWFDAGGAFKDADRGKLLRSEEVAQLIRKLQPECLINNRIGSSLADYGTPEQHIPGEIQNNAFEVCMTIQNRWGFNKFDQDYKSAETLGRQLIDTASKGGNFLLNVGPDGEGVIRPEFANPLRELGCWLKENGESIYGTRNSIVKSMSTQGYSTTRITGADSSTIYVHIVENPIDGKLELAGIANEAMNAYLLTDERKEALPLQQNDDSLLVKVPSAEISDIARVIAIDLKGVPLTTRQTDNADSMIMDTDLA